uniref:EB domain-containing protein n=1 Tax=Romanomermis culicivorax TaxID=13658 RepID=A0A915KKE8_ROMCU
MFRVPFGGDCRYDEHCKAAYSACVKIRCTCREGFVEMADRGICGTSKGAKARKNKQHSTALTLVGQMPTTTDQFLTCTAPKSGVYTSTECTDNEFCYFHTNKIYQSKFYQGRCCPKLNQTSLVNFAVGPMTVPIKQGCEFCNYQEECSENFGWSNVL